MNISRIIESSFNDAVKVLTMGTSRSSLFRARERAYVKSLIAVLQGEYDNENQRVFASAKRGNAADFATNHLLYDIAICRIGAGRTAERKPEDFLYIAEALWQIEVDLSSEWRSAIQAVNRLNCGAAADKLLVASSLAQGNERLLKTLRAPAAAGKGRLHIAFVPHPEAWDDDFDAPQVWRLAEDGWAAAT